MSAAVESSSELTLIDLETLQALAQAAQPQLFAVLDACDEPSVPIFAKQMGVKAASLYRGKAEQDHAKIAPYVVAVDPRVLEWIHGTLWGKPWGFFAMAGCDLQSLRRHFRRFLLVEGPESKDLYFRFYDPRVLQPFLESAEPEKLKRFFGPIEAMYLVDADLEIHAVKQSNTTRKTQPDKSNPRIVFTQQNMESFARARRAIFARRLLAQILGTLDEMGRSAEQHPLKQHVNEGIERALTYEMNAQRDIARYVETLCVHLQGFSADRDPIPIRDILLDRRVDWSIRLDRLEEYARSNSEAGSAEAS